MSYPKTDNLLTPETSSKGLADQLWTYQPPVIG